MRLVLKLAGFIGGHIQIMMRLDSITMPLSYGFVTF